MVEIDIQTKKTCLSMAQDYYQILGVDKGASAEQLKKAYYKLAKEYHPDRKPGDKAAEKKFKEISSAYDVLSDPQKRAAYDQFGESAFQNGGGPQGPQGFHHGFHASGGFGDIFEEMFNMFNGGQRQPAANMKQKGNDIRFDVVIDLEEAFHGVTKDLRFSCHTKCGSCSGSGSTDGTAPSACSQCGGTGRLRVQQGFFIIEQTCHTCGGAGMKITSPCAGCAGTGRVYQPKNLSTKIPAGVNDGIRIRIAGEGESGMRGGTAGDLYVHVSIRPHKIFKRQENDLLCQMPIPMTTAILGGAVEVPTIEGEPYTLDVPAGVQSGHVVRVKDKGMAVLNNPVKRGELLVELAIETPINLTARQQELMKEFAEIATMHSNSPQTSGFFGRMKDFFQGRRA